MDRGSFLSLLEASQSAVESSDEALRAAENALAAARFANSQAKTVLRAVQEFSAGGGGGGSRTEQKNKCDTCKKKKCLHGELLQEFLFKDPSGLIVRAIGDSWTSKYIGKIGKIVSCNQSKKQKFLNVQWENLSRTENFTFSSKGGPKFAVECKLKPAFPELQIKPKNNSERESSFVGLKGSYLTEGVPNPSGMKVRAVGKSFPERYRDALGTVIIKQGPNITIRWDNTGEIRENTIDSKSGPRFIIESVNNSLTTSPAPVSRSISAGGISQAEESEEEEFIMLSSNKNPVVDLDEDEEGSPTKSRSDAIMDVDDERIDGEVSDLINIDHSIIQAEEEDKFTILLKLLQSNEKSKKFLTVIVAENVFSITMYCNAKGYPCIPLLFESKKQALEMIFEREKSIIVTTSYFAYDLDISIHHLILFDFPTSIASFKQLCRKTEKFTKVNHNVLFYSNNALVTTFFNDHNLPLSLEFIRILEKTHKKIPEWLRRRVRSYYLT